MTENPISIPERTQQHSQEHTPRLQAEREPKASGMSRTHQLAIALYEHGHSARDVGELLDLPRGTVSGLVTKVGVSRGRDEAVRLALRNRLVRTHVQHVTLLGDVVADVAAKLGITADLLLAVLADRLHVTDRTTDRTTDRMTDRVAERVAERGDDAAVPVARGPVAGGGPSCVGVCSFGCTHRCARRTAPVGTAG